MPAPIREWTRPDVREMIAMRIAGVTLQAIASSRSPEITREAVRQALVRYASVNEKRRFPVPKCRQPQIPRKNIFFRWLKDGGYNLCYRCGLWLSLDQFSHPHYCRQCNTAYAYAYRHNHSDRMREVSREYRAKTPRIKARNLVYYAVATAKKNGGLVAQPCEKCGGTPAEAHHENYAKPLDVHWLCRLHHKQAHKRG